MNLRVDLILDTEQRSASFFNLKMLIRMLTILLPAGIAALALMQYVEYSQLQSRVRTLENGNEVRKPKVERAEQLRGQVQKNQATEKELAGFRSSGIDWHRQLHEFMKVVPAKIELDSLRITQAFATESGKPVRKFTLTIQGKSKDEMKLGSVPRFENTLKVNPFFSQFVYVPSVKVGAFQQDKTPGATKNDRIFRIDCNYKPRNME